ncbi:MAG: hypothetical protein K1W19_06160 [Lachnospiraceae bacterium]
MELKNRVIVVNEKNMSGLIALYRKCSLNELERIVNNIIDNAIIEIQEDMGVAANR